MNRFVVLFLQLIALLYLANASVYSHGLQVGWACKTALTNITFECTDQISCICDEPKRRSFIYCSMTRTKNQQEFNESLAAIKPSCPMLADYIFENDTIHAPSEVIPITSDESANVNITVPIIIPKEMYNFAYLCVRALYGQLELSSKLGTLILAYWLLISLIQAGSNHIYRVFPRIIHASDLSTTRLIRKHVVIPATFGYTHSSIRSFFGYTFSIPTRFETLIIVGHSLLNIAIYFPGYDLIEDTWFGSPLKTVQFQGYLGWRSGVFAIVHVPLLYLFAGRNNILISLTGWSMDTFNVYHRWLARWTMIHTAIHTVSYYIDFKNLNVLDIAWTRPYWLHGVAACIFGSILIVHAIHYLRCKYYELFLVSHIILAVGFTVTAYYHVYYLGGNNDGTILMYASIVIWASDRIMRIFRICYSGLNSVADTKLYPDGTIKMTVTYSNAWNCRPSQYVFIHILKWNIFWQSHPFTIIESPLSEDKSKLVLLIKTRNGFSKQIYNELEKQYDKSLPYSLLIDGPYGEEKPVDQYDNVILVAGGIGITGVYCYASWLKNKELDIRVVLIWCIPNESSLEWFKDELKFLAQDERFEIHIYMSSSSAACADINSTEIFVNQTGNKTINKTEGNNSRENMTTVAIEHTGDLISDVSLQMHYSRVDAESVIEEEITSSIGSAAVMCCGPGPLNDDVRSAISNCLFKSKSRVDYFEESFSW